MAFGLLPAFLKSAVGSIARTTPVKAASNAAMSISRRPTRRVVDDARGRDGTPPAPRND